MLSSTNEGSESGGIRRDVEIREIALALPIRTGSVQGKKRELGGRAPPDAGLKWMYGLEEVGNGGNNLVPEFPQKAAEISCHVPRLCIHSQGTESRRQFSDTILCD